jgi:nitrile hydratase subunit alpha
MTGLHDHPHDHAHDHAHPTAPDAEGPHGYYQVMEVAVRELLLAKGIITAEALRRQIERMDGANAGRGGALVARAWLDPEFKARALEDGSAAARELGLEVGAMRLIVVESTAALHNLVVCTLCSCYPRPLLGLPPDWYKSRAYRSRAVREPRAVLAEFGTIIPDEVEVRVHDSTADMRYLVLPERPAGTEGWDAERLAALVTRDSMIGVARVATPLA